METEMEMQLRDEVKLVETLGDWLEKSTLG